MTQSWYHRWVFFHIAGIFEDKINAVTLGAEKEVKVLADQIPLAAGLFAESSQALTKGPSHLLQHIMEMLSSYKTDTLEETS